MLDLYFDGTGGIGTAIYDLLGKSKATHVKVAELSQMYPSIECDEEPVVLWTGPRPTRRQIKRRLRKWEES